MRREIFERLTLFVLPFALYYVWLQVQRLRPQQPPRRHPWTLLTIAGLVLFGASFIVWGLTDREPTTGTYVAPHLVNGKVVPGYVAPAETKP